MTGFLIPAWYKDERPKEDDMNIASIIWGFSLAMVVFTAGKATRQTAASIKRGKMFTSYLVMVWLEWMSCVTISFLSWFFLKGEIEPSFWIYFAFLCLWVIQIQCILQIIINRIALLMVVRRKATILKVIVGIFIGLVNVSVFVIWIPARLQISEEWIAINSYWNRIEKVIFLAVDAALNAYFIYLIRSRLIANGLSKYNRLVHFNYAMVAVSISMDIILIGVMSLPSGVVYIQFHPLVYLVKLHIEMNIAHLIGKVVKASNPNPSGSNGLSYSGPHSHALRSDVKMNTIITANRDGHVRLDDKDNDPRYAPRLATSNGIQKTVETQVVHQKKPVDDDRRSDSSAEGFNFKQFS